PGVRSNRRTFIGRRLHRKPGVRIPRGDGRETRAELAQPALVLLNREAEIRAYSVLEQRVNARRHRGSVARLDLVEARPVVAVDMLRRLALRPRKLRAQLSCETARLQRFGPGAQRHANAALYHRPSGRLD